MSRKESVWYCKGCNDYMFRGLERDLGLVCPVCNSRLVKVVYDVYD